MEYYGGEMKRADKRFSITILVLGDEGVGKSSLISTFVSRYFSEVVPGIMTRVRLPPDPSSSCVTTIVDSQGGDAALMQAIAAMSTLRGHGAGGAEKQGGVDLTASTDSLTALMERAESSLTKSGQVAAKQSKSSRPSGSSGAALAGSGATALASSTTAVSSPASAPLPPAISGAIENVDSIVLVYDLDRVETFFRLENHWLPLIERCYSGKIPVIVAENKMDLFRPSSLSLTTASAGGHPTVQTTADEQALARKRQQIVSLMQRFPFIRQCIKCSAKNLLRVDDIFLKAQQAVLYPFTPPLYNLETGELSVECERALTRIFRMFDRDHDGLLADSELDRFQRETYNVAIFDRDLAAWKKVVSRNHAAANSSAAAAGQALEPVLRDGKFTVAGFLAIFDVFISQNRLDVVWQALRKFCYDDDLNLHIPRAIIWPHLSSSIPESTGGSIQSYGTNRILENWKLSSSAKKFLSRLFHQFDSDKDGLLSQDDLVSIFSILPPPALPPWHPIRAPNLFEGCFSRPKQSLPTSGNASAGVSIAGSESSPSHGDTANKLVDSSLIVPGATPAITQSLISNSGISILSASDSLPSIDVGGIYPLSKSLSFFEWMGHWHAISAISPSVTRAELFRLGHVEDYAAVKQKKSKKRSSSDRRRKKSMVSPFQQEQQKSTTESVGDDPALKSREVRVIVLGRRSCGKTALLNALCGFLDKSNIMLAEPSAQVTVRAIDTTPTAHPETSTTFLKVRRKLSSTAGNGIGNRKDVEDGEEFIAHVVFTDVPEAFAVNREKEIAELLGSGMGNNPSTSSPKDRRNVCDLAMLVFDSNNSSSFKFVKELESTLLTNETPRVFIGTKADQIKIPEPEDGDVQPATVMDIAEIHCRESDLEPPLLTSAAEMSLSSMNTSSRQVGADARSKVLDHLVRCSLTDEPGIVHLKSRPHEEQKRKEAARRRKMMWFGGIVSMGVAVAVGVGLLWGSSSKSKDQKVGGGGLSWLRSWFTGSSRFAAPAVKE